MMKKLKLYSELSDREVSAMAARDPLPDFADEADELYQATEFARRNAKTVACNLLKLGADPIAKLWKAERREILENRRFEEWTKRHDARFDFSRGKYLIHNPNPELTTV